MVTADTAALYRETELARQILADEERGTFPRNITLTEGSLVEDLLRFGGDGGATEIVRMALARVDWPRNDVRWFRMLAAPLTFWHHIPWLQAGNKDAGSKWVSGVFPASARRLRRQHRWIIRPDHPPRDCGDARLDY